MQGKMHLKVKMKMVEEEKEVAGVETEGEEKKVAEVAVKKEEVAC